MAASHYINVRWQPGEQHLTVEPKQVQVVSDLQHWIWDFYGIPNNYFPQVQFITDTVAGAKGPYGPFQNLTQSSWRVIGSGNTGVTGTYPYQVALVPATPPGEDAPPTITTAPETSLLVHNHVDQRTPQDIQVTLEETPDGHRRLVVTPENIMFVSGQSLTWRFEGIQGLLDQPWYPSIEFIQVPQGAVNVHLGPFSSMQQFDSKVVGVGNNFFPGSYGYIAVIRHATTHGVLEISSEDPAIGNEGNPPGGGGGS